MKTQKPILLFTEAFVVRGWDTEMKTGCAHKFTALVDGICSYENKYLFYENNKTDAMIVSGYDIVFTKAKADEKLREEKQKYLKFCKEQVAEYTEKVKSLTDQAS